MFQPWREWIAFLSGGPGFEQHEVAFGPCDRNVGESFGFRLALPGVVMAGGIPQSPVWIERHAPAGRAISRRYAPERTFRWRRGFPQIRTDHHGILQTLAAVNGHHRHCTRGKVAERLPLFRDRVGWVKPLASQPIGTAGGVQTLAVHGVLHKSRTLLKISEQSAAAREIRHGLPIHQTCQATHQPKPRQVVGQSLHL